jgi:hypothetical protein
MCCSRNARSAAGGTRADDAVDLLAVADQHEQRDVVDAEAARDRRRMVDVELDDLQPAAYSCPIASTTA